MTRSSSTTLQEVARKADVSVAAVSYVLNGKGRISEQRRQRIGRLLLEAGLKPRDKRRPAFYISDHREYRHAAAFMPFLDKYEGLNAAFHEEDVDLRVEFLHRPGSRDLRFQLRELASYKPAAVALDSDLGGDLPIVAEFFERRRVPVTQIGHAVRAPGVDAVVVDDFTGAYRGTQHLIAGGHRQIAMIRWNIAGDPASNRKYAGYQCALREAGIDERPQYVVESPLGRQEDRLTGRTAVAQLLALPDPPTAVLVENSFVSASLLYPIDSGETGLPHAIAGLDMVHFEAWHLDVVEQVMAGVFNYPSRRTKLLRINWQELGQVAAKRMLARMRGKTGVAECIQLAPQLYQVQGEEMVRL
ncbi:MAG: LacI family DNA-binding transcriptional regulator [Phycisphaeraceae bacterium]